MIQLYGNPPALTSQAPVRHKSVVWVLGALKLRTNRLTRLVCTGLLLTLCSATSLAQTPLQTEGSVKPELVLVIAVDQLRRDRLLDNLPGGLGQLLRGGRVYVNAQLAHALSTTCPGHVTMLTGRFPGPIGVPDNAHLDRGQWQQWQRPE